MICIIISPSWWHSSAHHLTPQMMIRRDRPIRCNASSRHLQKPWCGASWAAWEATRGDLERHTGWYFNSTMSTCVSLNVKQPWSAKIWDIKRFRQPKMVARRLVWGCLRLRAMNMSFIVAYGYIMTVDVPHSAALEMFSTTERLSLIWISFWRGMTWVKLPSGNETWQWK